ncbi:MAG: hypothetical protein LBH84_01200, partial [Prevotellaceae bacterium]|nr:hypothetical protein [Prevotellaceae bacterium]
VVGAMGDDVGGACPTNIIPHSSYNSTLFPFPSRTPPSFRSAAREARASEAEEPQPLHATTSNRSWWRQ